MIAIAHQGWHAIPAWGVLGWTCLCPNLSSWMKQPDWSGPSFLICWYILTFHGRSTLKDGLKDGFRCIRMSHQRFWRCYDVLLMVLQSWRCSPWARADDGAEAEELRRSFIKVSIDSWQWRLAVLYPLPFIPFISVYKVNINNKCSCWYYMVLINFIAVFTVLLVFLLKFQTPKPNCAPWVSATPGCPVAPITWDDSTEVIGFQSPAMVKNVTICVYIYVCVSICWNNLDTHWSWFCSSCMDVYGGMVEAIVKQCPVVGSCKWSSSDTEERRSISWVQGYKHQCCKIM